MPIPTSFGSMETAEAYVLELLALGNDQPGAPPAAKTNRSLLYGRDRGNVEGKMAPHLLCEDGTTHVFGDLSGVRTSNPGAVLQINGLDGNTDILRLVGSNGTTRFGVTDSGSVSGLLSFSGALTVSLPSLGTTSTDGLILTNPTAAAIGAQQISPRMRWTGRGFATTPNASQVVDYIAELVPVQGSAIPQAQLNFNYQINAGGYPTTPTMSLLNGNVGIGTTSPTSLLALGGTAARTIQMERNITAATAGQGLTLYSGGAIAGTADLAGGDLTLKSGTSTGTGTSALRFFTATAGVSGVADNAPTEKMTILGNGNVGIGTTAPGAPLDVVDSVQVSPSVAYNANPHGNFQLWYKYNLGGAYTSGALVQLAKTNAIDGDYGSDIRFTTRQNGVAASEKMRIDGPGNVGINTASFGASAAMVLALGGPATAPTTSPASAFQLYPINVVGAGTMGLAWRSEDAGLGILGSRNGFGLQTPTAIVHLAAGTTSLAPLKFTAGTNLTTPAAGAVEYNGTLLFLTDGTATRRTIYSSGGTAVALADGGTGASLIASNGGIFYSTASAGAILAGTATAGQILRSGASAAPAWSAATYPAVATGAGTILRADGTNWLASTLTIPDTAAINTLLYASAANIISALAAANNGVLVTGATGIPAIATDIPTAVTIGGQFIYRVGGTDVALADGGLNASLTASNGGIFYSTATAGAILAGTATANQMLLSGLSAAPIWSTAIWPSTTTINQLLYSSAANTVAGLATANNAILATGATGVPVLTTDIPTAVTVGGQYNYRVGGNKISVADGGTGVGSWINGQLLVGNTTGNTAALATLTGTANQIIVTNGASSITLATPQDIGTASTPQHARMGLGIAADATDILKIGGDNARPLSIAKSTVAVSAPGAGVGMMRWEAGTTAGTLKLVAYSGTSTTGATIVDNVGSGN